MHHEFSEVSVRAAQGCYSVGILFQLRLPKFDPKKEPYGRNFTE